MASVQDVAGKQWTYEYETIGWRRMLKRVAFDNVTYAGASYNSTWRAVVYMENGESWTLDYQTDQTVKWDASGNEWRYGCDAYGVIQSVCPGQAEIGTSGKQGA